MGGTSHGDPAHCHFWCSPQHALSQLAGLSPSFFTSKRHWNKSAMWAALRRLVGPQVATGSCTSAEHHRNTTGTCDHGHFRLLMPQPAQCFHRSEHNSGAELPCGSKPVLREPRSPPGAARLEAMSEGIPCGGTAPVI